MQVTRRSDHGRDLTAETISVLEAIWADALWKLKLAAEFEAGRRGPRPRRRTKEKTSR